MSLYGGIEAGGTKFVCAVGTRAGEIRAETRFPTMSPEKSIRQAIEFFGEQQQVETLRSIGIASFGPVDPDQDSKTHGFVTTTPKPGWAHTDFAGQISRALELPVGFDTDVNGAALGEYRWGNAKGLDTFVYLTIGTGLGGGGMANGRLIHGLMHPEMGHMRIPHDTVRDPYSGFCTYHGDCWEGLAAGPAIEERWQTRGDLLPPEHPAWDLEAHYLALGIVNIICVLSPQRIIMGGGVMEQRHLFPLIANEVQGLLNEYVQKRQLFDDIDEYIVPPALGSQAGVLGAIALAMEAEPS